MYTQLNQTVVDEKQDSRFSCLSGWLYSVLAASTFKLEYRPLALLK